MGFTLAIGVVNGATGVPGGSMLSPILIALGIHSAVAGSSLLFVGVIVTLASSVLAVYADLLNLEYGAVVLVLTVISTYPGILY